MSLRSRLLAATLLLVAAGLLVTDVATYRFLSAFLLRRVDRQLEAAALPAIRALALADAFPGGRFADDGARALFPAGTYAAVLDHGGRVLRDHVFAFQQEPPPPPALPPGLPGSSGATSDEPARFSTPARDGHARYRVLAAALLGGGTFVVAVPLDEVDATLARLLGIEAAVTAAVLAGLGGLAWWIVRLGFQPLERMAETAGAIAAGDLSRRVEPAEPRTEVGRLGLALNAMLARIEGAFAERRASEERLRRFVADASHELRTPLTSIRGYSELFRRGAADRPEDLARVMRRIEEEGARMGELVDELALLARLDQGLPLEREPVDLAELAEAAVEAARATDPARPLDLDARGPVVVEGDPRRLRQVVDNLLANARQHTPAGTPVHVRVRAEGGVALLEVADEGPGVPPEHAGRIFERFYRVEASRSRDHGGAGLGLSIVEAVARAHAGSAAYRPRPGGAVFEVRLPLPGAKTSKAAPASLPAPSQPDPVD